MFDQVTVHTTRTELRTGDAIVLYTDGITDLPPPHGIRPEQLVDVVAGARTHSAQHIAASIHRSLQERVPDRSRRDDAALLVVAIR